jgi:hypothetical protein
MTVKPPGRPPAHSAQSSSSKINRTITPAGSSGGRKGLGGLGVAMWLGGRGPISDEVREIFWRGVVGWHSGGGCGGGGWRL